MRLALNEAEAISITAAHTGVRALMELHDGYIAESASGAMRILHNLDPRCVGVIHDPENMSRAGKESWKLSFQILGEYLAYVHVKNGRWRFDDSLGKFVWARTGIEDGLVDWAEIVGILRERGYAGPLVLEDTRQDVPADTKNREGQATLRRLLRTDATQPS